MGMRTLWSHDSPHEAAQTSCLATDHKSNRSGKVDFFKPFTVRSRFEADNPQPLLLEPRDGLSQVRLSDLQVLTGPRRCVGHGWGHSRRSPGGNEDSVTPTASAVRSKVPRF